MDKIKQALRNLPAPPPPETLKADVMNRIAGLPAPEKAYRRQYITGGVSLIAASVAVFFIMNSSFPGHFNALTRQAQQKGDQVLYQAHKALDTFDLADIFKRINIKTEAES